MEKTPRASMRHRMRNGKKSFLAYFLLEIFLLEKENFCQEDAYTLTRI